MEEPYTNRSITFSGPIKAIAPSNLSFDKIDIEHSEIDMLLYNNIYDLPGLSDHLTIFFPAHQVKLPDIKQQFIDKHIQSNDDAKYILWDPNVKKCS